MDLHVENFLWTESITKRKLVPVAWEKMCQPIDKGGLGFCNLGTNNLIVLKKFA